MGVVLIKNGRGFKFITRVTEPPSRNPASATGLVTLCAGCNDCSASYIACKYAHSYHTLVLLIHESLVGRSIVEWAE